MIVKYGEQQPVEVNAGTIGGIQVNVLLVAAAADYSILTSDFLPQNVQITSILKRAGQQYTLCNDNLLLLGTYSTRLRNLNWFLNGYPLINAASGVIENLLLTAYIKFESPIVLQPGDVLTTKVNNQVGCMSSNINTNTSYVEFLIEPTVGTEFGIPIITNEVVQQNSSNGTYVNADNVCRIEIMNFDQINLATPVVSTMALSSQQYSHNATFNQMLGDEARKIAMAPPYLYGTSLPVNPGSLTVFRGLDYYPQSFRVWPIEPSDSCQALLTQAKLNLTFNSSVVNASQNWVANTRLIITQKHMRNFSKK